MDNALHRVSIKKKYCQHCGIGPEGFSIVYDWTVKEYISIWDTFCSLSCAARFKLLYSKVEPAYILKDDAIP